MLTPQESRLLTTLRRAGGPLDEQGLRARVSLPPAHLRRVLTELEWRGLVVVLQSSGGAVAMLTPRGQQAAAARTDAQLVG